MYILDKLTMNIVEVKNKHRPMPCIQIFFIQHIHFKILPKFILISPNILLHCKKKKTKLHPRIPKSIET